MGKLSEEKRIIGGRGENAEARKIDDIVRRIVGYVPALCRKWLDNPEDIEDQSQEAWLRAFLHFRDKEPDAITEEALKARLYFYARSAVFDWFRRNRRGKRTPQSRLVDSCGHSGERRPIAGTESIDQLPARADSCSAEADFLDDLEFNAGTQVRTIVKLMADGYSQKDAAKILRVCVKTIGRKKLEAAQIITAQLGENEVTWKAARRHGPSPNI